MDIVTISNKIRESHSMLSGLLTKDQKKMINFTKDYVVDLDKSSESEP